MSESNTNPSVHGKDGEGLPGSESVARAKGNTWNEGDPKSPCRTMVPERSETKATRALPMDPICGRFCGVLRIST